MVRRSVVAVAVAVLVFASVLVVEGPAVADTPGCVTKLEYRHVLKGTRIRTVHRIFDTRGWFIDGGAGGFARGYRFCPRAQHLAGARSFRIIYATDIRNGQLISTRVWVKYCGRTYASRRACF